MKIHNAREALQVHDSDITESRFFNSKLAVSTFDDVDLKQATFSNVNLSRTEFIDVNLTNVSINDANLTGMKINGVLVSDLFHAYQNRGRVGAVLFARDLLLMQKFYQDILKLDVEHAENDYVVLRSSALQLVIHTISEDEQPQLKMEHLSRLRVNAPIKLVFEVNNIAEIRSIASIHGGEVFSAEREWQFQAYRVCDGCDPEGNVVQFRQIN